MQNSWQDSRHLFNTHKNDVNFDLKKTISQEGTTLELRSYNNTTQKFKLVYSII